MVLRPSKKIPDPFNSSVQHFAVIGISPVKTKAAFKIFSTFKAGFTVDERKMIKTGYEILVTGGGFYKSLGINIEQALQEANKLLQKKFEVKTTELKKSQITLICPYSVKGILKLRSVIKLDFSLYY